MASIQLPDNKHIPNPFIKSELSIAYWSIPKELIKEFNKEWALREYDPEFCIEYAKALKEL